MVYLWYVFIGTDINIYVYIMYRYKLYYIQASKEENIT